MFRKKLARSERPKTEEMAPTWPRPQVVASIYPKQVAVGVIMDYLFFQSARKGQSAADITKTLDGMRHPSWVDEASMEKDVLDAIMALSGNMRTQAFPNEPTLSYRVIDFVRDLSILSYNATVKDAATKAMRAAGY